MIKRLRIIGILIFSLGLFATPAAYAQDVFKEEILYTDLKLALENPLKVKRLSLSGQKLKKIPKEVAQFKNLQYLDISKNQITEFPDFIGSFSKLEEIDAYRNKIEVLPDTMKSLKRLKKLDMGKNQIYSLPPFLAGMHKLEQINLSFNPVFMIPEFMGRMQGLRFIDLRNTDIEQEYFEEIKSILPNAQIEFTQGCNCGPGH